MKSRRQRGRRTSIAVWTAIAAFALILIALGGGFAYLLYVTNRDRVALDEHLCPTKGPSGQVVVLVDTTDPLSTFTQKELLTRLLDVSRKSQKGERIEIRVLEPGENRTRILFDFCNPGDGSDLNEITGNPRLALQRWRDGFEKPLSRALADSIKGSEATSSPIMAALQAIAIERLTAESDRQIPTRIVVASDMMEHTEYFSIYRSGADFDAYRNTKAATRFSSDLAGASVEILYVPRVNSEVGGIALMDFWDSWITESDGHLKSALKLQGAQ
jgi:hypothetical protein